MSDYVKNLWYMAAWEEEIVGAEILARPLLDRDWILFRREDGSYALLRDRCPHRFVALSMGKRVGDAIQCAYHGLTFDGEGACVRNPFGGQVTPGAKVETMPVVARYGILWFWPGEPARADPDTIPDFAFVRGPMHNRRYTFPVDYRLIVDNLMDLSHAEFIHTETFGTNGGLLDYGTQKVRQHDDGSISNDWDIDGAHPPFFAEDRLPPDGRIDQQIHIRWYAPASLALTVRIRNAETQEALLPAMTNPHILTPETSTSTHYFFTDGPEPHARELTKAVSLGEDEPIVAASQRGMEGRDFRANRPVILPTDAAAIRVRRRMTKLLRDEQEPTPAPADTALLAHEA